MECHDRYFMIAVDRSIAGDQAQFEAVGMSFTSSSLAAHHISCVISNVKRADGFALRCDRRSPHHWGICSKVWLHRQSAPCAGSGGAASLILQLPHWQPSTVVNKRAPGNLKCNQKSFRLDSWNERLKWILIAVIRTMKCLRSASTWSQLMKDWKGTTVLTRVVPLLCPGRLERSPVRATIWR